MILRLFPILLLVADKIPFPSTLFVAAVGTDSRFREEPTYHSKEAVQYDTPEIVDNEPRFMQTSESSESSVPAPTNPDQAGNAALKPGNNFKPGNYFPPTLPYRFPSHPYDNPSYTPFPAQYAVPQPPAWRSDALETHSDGARYLENMSKYDYYPAK